MIPTIEKIRHDDDRGCARVGGRDAIPGGGGGGRGGRGAAVWA